jgi:hypothetical protein
VYDFNRFAVIILAQGSHPTPASQSVKKCKTQKINNKNIKKHLTNAKEPNNRIGTQCVTNSIQVICMDSGVKSLLGHTKFQSSSVEFHYEHRTSPKHFTRSSVLGFENTALLILKLIKKSAKVELMDFFYEYNKELEIPSRQAFSEAREKISYLAFKDFFMKSCEIAEEGNGARLYKGYRLFAVDGTSFVVGSLSKLSEFFGESTCVKDKAMCRISAVVDVLNDCIVNAEVSPFSVGERVLAMKQIEQLETVVNALYIFDRGYWSPKLTSDIIKNNQKFLMRLASNVDKTVVTDANGEIYPLRRYQFVLPSGEIETLLTNLTEEEVSNDELAALYAKRWGVETKYLELKSRLQINKFSGESINIILQDIYATLYISNLVAFICFESDKAIKAKNAYKNNKYEQKTNRSTCISTLRKRFVGIIFIKDTAVRNAALDRLADDISKDIAYIGKSKPRPRNNSHIKDARGKLPRIVL